MSGKELFQRLSEAARKYRYLLIVIAAGVVLLLLPTGRSGGTDTASTGVGEPSYQEFQLDELRREIESALESMSGVGKTEVVLTLRSTMETVYQTDTRSEQDSDSRSCDSDTVLVSAGSGVQSPVVATRIYPQFRGALVVCDGGDSPAVRLEVTRAVAALTGLSSDRITVTRRDAG